MKMTFLISFLLAVTINSYSQQINIYPTFGFQYTGLTNYGNSEKPKSDFKSPIPTIAEYLGFEVTYNPQNSIIIHKLNLQRTVIGTTTQISSFDMLGTKGLRYREYSGIEQLLLSYHCQITSKRVIKILKTKSLQLFYSLGFGIGFNKSKGYYNEQFNTDSFYTEYQQIGQQGYSFLGWDATYTRKGLGLFIIPEVGFNYLNRKMKNIFKASFFYDIGLKQMIESQQHYFYGISVDPSKNVDRYQKLFSRGSVFGFKIGIPIKVLNKQSKKIKAK